MHFTTFHCGLKSLGYILDYVSHPSIEVTMRNIRKPAKILCYNRENSNTCTIHYSAVAVDSPGTWPMMWNFALAFVVSLNKLLYRQSRHQWFAHVTWATQYTVLARTSRAPFTDMIQLNFIPVWIRNHMPSKIRDEIPRLQRLYRSLQPYFEHTKVTLYCALRILLCNIENKFPSNLVN